MAETASFHVQLIAKTEFVAPPDVPWSTDSDGGQALVEFAGGRDEPAPAPASVEAPPQPSFLPPGVGPNAPPPGPWG